MSKSTISEKQKKAKAMDGPVVKWCPGDLFKENAPVFMAYHCSASGLYYMNWLGTAVGGASYAAGLYQPLPTALATMGTTGLYAGAGGAALGLAAMLNVARKGNQATPIPWNDEGINMRRDGLAHNFGVRVLDLSVWSGIGMAASVMGLYGGPIGLGLSPGRLGWLQGLSLGAAVGTTSALACMTCYKQKEKKELEADDDDN